MGKIVDVIQVLSDEEVKALVDRVGRHLMLPNKKPQIVTITNVDQLKIDQPFFRLSNNGDKLLIFSNRVILYRPDIDKVIDIAQIRTASNSAITVIALPPQATRSAAPFTAFNESHFAYTHSVRRGAGSHTIGACRISLFISFLQSRGCR